MNIKTPKSTELIDALIHKQYLKRHLEKIKKHNPGTLDHSVRVGTLAADIGYERNLSDREVKMLAVAGLLHDLGKCDISNDILEKQGPLTKEERKVVEKHAWYGYNRIKERFLRNVRNIVAHHHDRKSGKTSHVTREKESILYYTKVISAVDMFDALANNRPYKKKFTKSQIKKIMEAEFPNDKTLTGQVLARY